MKTAAPQERGYRLGTAQGILLIAMGSVGLLLGGLHNWPAVSLDLTFIGAGICLLWRMKGGVVLLLCLCGSIIWHLLFDGGYPQVSLVLLVFFAAPVMFYYPKRWKQLSWNGAKKRRTQERTTRTQLQSKQSTLLPDFGRHLVAKGTPKSMLIFTSWEMDTLQVNGSGQYCTTRVQPLEGRLYCVTFDFDGKILNDLMQAATERTCDFIAEKLIDDPFSVRSMILPDPINVGVAATLGSLQRGLHDLFIPLVITEVLGVGKHEETTLH